MGSKGGPWIETATHQKFHLLAPTTDQVCIEDIAIHLSHLPRFNGAIQEPYSVAEHSIHCARLCSKKAKKAALLHDAHEAYSADFTRPLKRALAELAKFDIVALLHQKIDRVIEHAFGIKFSAHAGQVGMYDGALLIIEAEIIQHSPILDEWSLPEVPSEFQIEEAAFRGMRAEFVEAENYQEYCRDKFLELYEKYV